MINRNITPEKCHKGLNTQIQPIDRNMNSYFEVMTPPLNNKRKQTKCNKRTTKYTK